MKKIKFLKSQKSLLDKLFKTDVYYVYIHYKVINHLPIYVGKGKKYRCINSSSRNKKWNEIFNTFDIYTKIIQYDLSLEQANQLEKEVITKIGLDNLTNYIEGGIDFGIGIKFYGEHNGNFGNKGELNPISKKVICLDLKGNYIKTYNSIEETKQDGFVTTIVSLCCNNKRPQHKKYQFLFENNYDITKKYIYKRGKTSKRQVNQYTLDNKFVKTFISINDTIIDGFVPKNVQQVCSGYKNSHKGFIFKYSI